MKFSFYILSLFVVLQLFGQPEVVNINAGWNYLEKAYELPNQAKNDSNWESIDLPHSWNSIDATDAEPGYRRDASWYQKELLIEKKQHQRYFISFEGANIVTQVYVNGTKAGEHIGGYLGFKFDITDLVSDGSNELMVRVDNGYNREIIPSQKSDFFIYGGITRDVWLITVASAYVSNIKVTTPSVSKTKAKTQIELSIGGDIKNATGAKVSLINPNGKQVYAKAVSLKGKANHTLDFTLSKPMLWHVSDPNLYTVSVELLKGSKVIDNDKTRIGYRWYEFKEYGSFYLNGERLLIRGTHRHEEHAGYGAAMPNELHRKDMELIKGMGANFVRLGHYSQDPEVYEACDELGILVWDELSWCRGGVGNDVWKANTKRLLGEMINQNYNHPSIIFWSLGNEIYWLPDFENGDDRDEINSFLTELNTISHELDPYRKTAIRKYYEGADIVDVFSPSIWSGWYSGSYENYEKTIDKNIDKYPNFLHMEYGGSSHVGRHTETPITGAGFINPNEWEEAINQVEVANIAQNGDWSENYIVDLFDWHLKISESHPKFAGNAQWAFKDFATPLRPENDIPYMNQKGLTDREGNPKDAYYVFKSYWSDEPFAYIESHTWTERSGPEGLAREVNVFSNAVKVELFLNDKSQGIMVKDKTKFPASGLSWSVDFIAGANDLLAVGFDAEGKEITRDQMSVNYTFDKADAPEELVLTHQLLDNDQYLVTVTARDKNGLRCLEYEERVYFQCMSGGKLNDNLGTPTGTSAIKMANGAASIIVTPDDINQKVIMTVLNQSFKGSFLEILPKGNQ
ncbi:MAG: glycoside hydrolase family 2 protein [Cyclobacteriaceae bacterium]